MFDPCTNVQRAIDSHFRKLKAAFEKEAPDDLMQAVRASGGSDAEKTHFCLIKYGFRHFRDHVSPGDIFLVPREEFQDLRSLTDVITSTSASSPVHQPSAASSSSGAPVQALIDDSVNLQHVVVRTSCPSLLIEILATNPKRRKTLSCSGTGLKSDHMACVQYNVDSRDRAAKSFHISSAVSDAVAKDGSGVELVGVSAFLAVPGGMETLKKKVAKCTLEEDTYYHFGGQPLPSICHAMLGWDIVTGIMVAGAHPSEGSVWTSPMIMTDEQRDVLSALVQEGYLLQPSEHTYQFSQFGFARLRRSRRTSGFEGVFKISSKKQLKDMSTWELLETLQLKGWQLLPAPRGRVPPVQLEPGMEAKAVVFFNSKLEVSRDYAMCLSRSLELADAGVKAIEHKRQGGYYNLMIRGLDQDSSLLGVLMDDNAPLMSLPALQRDPSMTMSAIQDADEPVNGSP